jgi:hypothetical protein
MANDEVFSDRQIEIGNGSTGPFGDADASRVNFQTLKASFVPLSARKKDDSLDADISVRVIVGRRGAGKTLYLRSIQDYCKRLVTDSGTRVYVTDIDNQPPDTSLIVQITSWFEGNESQADEVWRTIWKFVILRTVYSHLFNSKELSKYVIGRRKKFQKEFSKIIPANNTPQKPFNQLASILSRCNSPKDLLEFLRLEEWADFEYEIGNLLAKVPPLYFFLDQLDDDFANAPYHWLKCQYGLFSAVFRFLRDDAYGGKLHVIVCIREVVYSYILQSQHGSKYLGDSKIKVLKWDKKLARHFLDKKIESIDKQYFLENSRTKNVETFFGIKEVSLKRQGGTLENIRTYILRHTMLLPREIINVGNIFCDELNNIDSDSDEELESAVKRTVSTVAKSIASDQLKMASLLICNQWIYNGAVEDGNYSEFYNNGSKLLTPIYNSLCKLIIHIGKDRFKFVELKSAHTNRESFDLNEDDDPLNALFRVGLLGYIELDVDGNEKVVFFSESKDVRFDLPFYFECYVFHSCLIDLLGIQPIGKSVF